MNYKETSQKVIVLIAILLVSLLVIRFQVGNTSKTILVPDDYHTINKAILKSTPGDTVFVKAGIYYENLFVNKTLTIQGENSKNTILIGTGNINRGERAVVTITANHVKIIGFTIKSQNYSSFSNYATGVSVEADNCVITENNISNTFYGIFCSVQSSTIISKNNIISNFKDGIRFCGGSLNNISENNITGNAKGGIAIEGYSNIISKNIITYNNRGIGLGSSYSLVYGNKIGNNNEFNFFFTGSKNIVCSNNISDSTWGIYFSPYFAAPIENKIYNNNFINNRANVGGTTSNNIQCWDNGFPIGGNYWGDYQVRYPLAQEINERGIGNKCYKIDDNNKDNYPLLAPFDISNETTHILESPPNAKPKSTVAFWSFDEIEPNGVTPDKTGLNFAFVGTSSEDISYIPRLVDGKFGKALFFNGPAYVNIPILPHVEILNETTIDVWINIHEFKNFKYNNIIVECLRTRSQSADRIFGLAVNGKKTDNESEIFQGALLGYVRTENEGFNEIATTEPVLTLNEWTHVIFTRSLSTGMHIYVNGEEKNITVTSGLQNPKEPAERGTELYIGHDSVCSIDEIQLINTAIKPISEQPSWIQLSFCITIATIILGAVGIFYIKFKNQTQS